MKIIKRIYNNIIQFILYKIHLKEFKLLWIYYEVDKKQFKQYLSIDTLLMYDKIADKFRKFHSKTVSL